MEPSYYITKMEAIMKQLTNQAALGDIRATTRMFFAMLDMFPEIKEPEPEESPDIYVQFLRAKDGKPARLRTTKSWSQCRWRNGRKCPQRLAIPESPTR